MGEAGKLPVGAILAGGRGRRIGGDKALIELGGRPLVQWPLRAMQQAVGDVIVVAKPDTTLPALAGVIMWREPAEPQHPLVGIVAALRAARGRSVLVCAADIPFVSVASLRGLAGADAQRAAAVVAVKRGGEGALQPLLARYEPGALALLEAAVGEDAPLRATVEALGVVRFEVPAIDLFNVNTPEDLARAEVTVIEQRRQM